MIRDFHYHIQFGELTKDIVPYFEKFRKMFDVEHINVQSIPMEGKLARLQNLKILMLKDLMYPYVFAGFGLYQGEGHKDYLTQLNEGLEQGFDNVKMLEAKPDKRKQLGKPIYDASFDPFYSAIEEKEIVLLMHSGDPSSSWDISTCDEWAIKHGRCYAGEGFLSEEEHYAEVDEVLKRHPKLKLALAHFYFLENDLDRAAEFLDKNPNVMLDLTPGRHFEAFSKNVEKAREFFTHYADRLIYGTDVNDGILTDKAAYHDRLYGMTIGMINGNPIPEFRQNGYCSLNLPDDIANKILYENHRRLFGDCPKRVNKQAVIKEILEIEKELDSLSDTDKRAFLEVKEFYCG